MAIELSTDLLIELGYEELTVVQANELLKLLYETLERLVGVEVARQLSDKQLDTFETFYDAGDDAGALAWLERNVPDYSALVHKVLDDLKQELRELAHADAAAWSGEGPAHRVEDVE